MPRRTPRYKNLLENLKKAGDNPDANSEAAKFLDFLKGKNKITIVNKPPEDARDLFNFGILPFATEPPDATAGNRVKTIMSAYSYNGMKKIGVTLANLGLAFIEGGEETESNYYPAVVRPSFRASGYTSNANKVSAVTGRTYNQVAKRSFTLPFGRQTTAEDAVSGAATANIGASDEADVLLFVRQAIQTGSESEKLVSVSYDPEVWKEISRAKDATADGDIPSITIDLAAS